MLKFFFSIIVASLTILILSRIINVKTSNSGVCFYLKEEIKESIFHSNNDRDLKERIKTYEKHYTIEKQYSPQEPQAEIRKSEKIIKQNTENNKDKQIENQQKVKGKNDDKSSPEDPIEEIIKKKF